MLVILSVALMLIPVLLLFGVQTGGSMRAYVNPGSMSQQSLFTRIIDNSSNPNMSVQTPFFAPFYYNDTDFFVYGSFVNFHYYATVTPPYSIILSNVEVDENGTNVTIYSLFQIQSNEPQSFVAHIMGSVFYAYSGDIMLVVHDNPAGLIQVYSTVNGTSVTSVFPHSFVPSTNMILKNTGLLSGQAGSTSIIFNSTSIDGYMVSAGSNFTEGSIGDSYYVTKAMMPGTFLNSFVVPNGTTVSSTVMSMIAEGMKYNTLTYLSEIYWSSSQHTTMFDASYYSDSFSVTGFAVRKGSVMLSAASNSSSAQLVVLVLDRKIFSSDQLMLKVNGRTVASEPFLDLMTDSSGNHTEGNITTEGNYYVVGAYSPTPIYSLQVVQKISRVNVASLVLPLALAAAITVAAAATLYILKRKE